MSHYKEYQEYKSSRLEWVDEIPEGWECIRAKFNFSLIKRPPVEHDGIVTAFRDGVVTLRSNRRTDGFTNAIKESGYQSVKKGDLVIHSMDAFAGAIGVSDANGKCSPVYSCCIPKNKKINTPFYAYVVRTMAKIGFIESLSKGIRERSTDFRWSMFAEQYLPTPPLNEQTAIATFLDRETSRIDRLIDAKKRFIERLKEKRQAMITHAVTKGLDPDVPMKDSGVEWIGEIPEGWEVKRIKWSISSIKNGIWGDDPKLDNQDIICVRVADFDRKNNRVAIDKPTIRNVKNSERVGRVLSKGDLLIEKSGGGENQPVGFVAIYDHEREAVCANFIAKAELAKGMHSKFWLYVHSAAYSVRLNIPSIKQTSGIQNLDSTSYLNEKAAFPSFLEQEKISGHLDDALSRIDKIMNCADKSIKLLKEKRESLITAAVTGKIDVRDEV